MISRKSATRSRPLYEPFDWVLVRAPLLPVDAYLGLGHGTANKVPGNVRLAPNEGLSADPRVRAALAVGGGNLYDVLARADPAGKDDPGSAAKLLRYLIRMSTRPTPYGLFAGVALGRWGQTTNLSFSSARLRTRTRPDMAWLLRLVLELETRREVRTHLRYIANSRAFVKVGRVFLPEAAPTALMAGPGPAISVRATNAVLRALRIARRPVPHAELVAQLAQTRGATTEKIEQLIDELWRQTLLLTDLRPPLSNPNPAAYVVGRLQNIPAAADVLERLNADLGRMAKWDELPIEEAAVAYRELSAPDAGERASSERSAQVDAALALNGSHITSTIAREAARAAELLLRLTPLPTGVPYLDAYRRAFEARYGPEREIPLLELLDPNFGLGAPSAYFHGAPAGGDPAKAAIRQQTLYELAITALRERQLIVELDEKMLDLLASWTPSQSTAPQSLDLSIFVIASAAKDVDDGRFQIVVGPNLGASAAGRNLGRFVDLLGHQAEAALHGIGRAEAAQSPDGLRAEIVYLPHRLRSANVAIRPHPRSYEIVLGTTPGRDPDRVIPLDELVVGVRSGRFYVRWPARRAEVFGCAGHMLNNMQAPDVCRFLDDLRRDGQAQFGLFDWGSAAGLPVLPRVQVGRIVLSPARWRIDAQSRAELGSDSPAAFQTGLRAWRTRWQVPRYVYLSFGDNRLLLDLEDQAQADELRAEVRRLAGGGQMFLQEALPAPEHAWVCGPGGHFITELVVTLILRAEESPIDTPTDVPLPVPVVSVADRLRPPGSDWLFVKLYCPRAFEDDLLTGPVAELCQQALAMGAADDWFFIRYADPDSHLRLRFHGNSNRLTEELFRHICAWANGPLKDELCTRMGFDTYDRELERFGGAAGMAVAEAIFAADSRAVIEMLRLSRGGVLEIDKTTLAVLSIDDLLASFGLSEVERVGWCRDIVMSRSAGSQEFRRRKDILRRLLGDPEYIRSEPGGDALSRILAARKGELTRIGRQLDLLATAQELTQPKNALLRSYVHLHSNRLLGVDRSAEEQALALLGRARYALCQAPFSGGISAASDALTARDMP